MKSEIKTKICIAGGGMAGVCAALAAARNGAKVILCQDRPVLGGNASSEIRMHISGADGLRSKALEVEAREGGIIEEIRLDCAVQNPQGSAAMLDLLLYDKCRREENLTLMLNTSIDSVNMDGNTIISAHAVRSSTEDEFDIRADIFIDCTGDGRLGAEAGAAYWIGDDPAEHRGEYTEKTYTACMGNSLLFSAHDIGQSAPFSAPPWAREFNEEQLRYRNHSSWEYGYWWIEYGGQLNILKDNEVIRDELMAILLGVWDHIKNSGNHPESGNWALDWVGFVPGKRESRRFVGPAVLSREDLQEATVFDDVIAYGGWPMDIHPTKGMDANDESPGDQPQTPYLYGIPLSACMSDRIDNLMFAGRDASITREAFSSTRVMATCAVMGQGVGTFAAASIKNKLKIHEARTDNLTLHAVQQQLLRQDAYLPGLVLDGESDMARCAKIRASSEQLDGRCENVKTPHTRSVFGEGGARPDQTVEGTHRWMSEPNDAQPWLELSWGEAVGFKRIELVLDTGMHRRLALTRQKSFRDVMQWGVQEETLKDFSFWADTGSGLEEILTVTGNYQRQRCFDVDLKNVQRLRLVVSAVNGLDHARVFQIRCEK